VIELFFGYPIAATAENWLHDCLVEMILRVHAELANGAAETLWPVAIPPEHREKLTPRRGLRDRLREYRAAVVELTAEQRQQIGSCLTQQNRIGELCDCSQDCELIDALPNECREPISKLFSFAFQLLSELGVRDRQYAAIFGSTPYRVCPFCGSEYFDAPGAPREDLDHYLARSRYPFAAVNLRNLVPMGMRCNERYKLAQDILRDTQGVRRRAFDPYGERAIGISLSDSVPFEGEGGVTPQWVVRFQPDGDECATWDAVFGIRLRIVRDVLNVSFKSWLEGFRSWIRMSGPIGTDAASIVDAIARYANHQADLGYNDRAFLKAAMFQMLRDQCAAGHARLLQLMRDLVTA
jgi:hypothetical protein